MRKVKETELQTWRERVFAWKKSKKSLAAQARENQLHYRKLVNWKVRLIGKGKAEGAPAGFVEVTPPTSSELIIESGSLRLLISREFDELTLARCLKVLRGL